MCIDGFDQRHGDTLTKKTKSITKANEEKDAGSDPE